MREEIISDVTYRIGSLNAKQQFNVLRRLGPVFAAAKPAAKLWVEQAAQSEAGAERPPLDAGQLVGDIFDSVGPLASALGTMPQLEDLDLRDNAFTDTGFQALVEAIRQHPGIKSLRLLNLGLNSEPYQEAVDQILGR